MKTTVQQLQADFIATMAAVSDLNGLEAIRVNFLGKKSQISDLLGQLGKLSIDDKKIWGPRLNQLKAEMTATLEEKTISFEADALESRLIEERIDFTLPSSGITKGSLHPITHVTRQIQQIFAGLGYIVAEGPEAETDHYNFSALNFGKDHPARDMHDTFYLDTPENRLLRTHTSGVQIHLMEEYKPPIRAITPGKVFRSDADVSHSPVFHQVEGLYVDKGVNMGHLKATLQHFFDQFFAKGSDIRLRPSYFPFTEPSVEADVSCVICKGKGCSMCKGSGWIEILGAGMVDPNVLRNVNIDPEEYSGFAFGMGVERLAILKYGITNIKLFYDNHTAFLEQFQ